MKQEKRFHLRLNVFSPYMQFINACISYATVSNGITVLFVDKDLHITEAISPFDSASCSVVEFRKECNNILSTANALILVIHSSNDIQMHLYKTYSFLSDLLGDSSDKLYSVFLVENNKLFVTVPYDVQCKRKFSPADFQDMRLRCYMELSDKSVLENHTYRWKKYNDSLCADSVIKYDN